MLNIVGVIPARMNSSRFPGKPLAKICGIPLVGHVYFRTKMCKALKGVYVATPDKEIAEYIEAVGGEVIMTLVSHERASDRAAEAMTKIEQKKGFKIDILVMIQGDEPMLYPEMIDSAIKPMLEDKQIQVVNLMAPLKSKQEQEDPNQVKVVVDKNNFALYFSREPIPSWRKGAKEVIMHKQVCIVPFRRDFLIKFYNLKPTPLEAIESVDMLRILENGYKIKMVLSSYQTHSVDTIEDLKRVEELIESDPLFSNYRYLSSTL